MRNWKELSWSDRGIIGSNIQEFSYRFWRKLVSGPRFEPEISRIPIRSSYCQVYDSVPSEGRVVAHCVVRCIHSGVAEEPAVVGSDALSLGEPFLTFRRHVVLNPLCWAVEVLLDITHRVTSEKTWILNGLLIQNISCIFFWNWKVLYRIHKNWLLTLILIPIVTVPNFTPW